MIDETEVENKPVISGDENKIHEKLLVDTSVSECSLINKDKEVCASDNAVKHIANVIGVNPNEDKSKIIETAKKETNCDSERCVIEKTIKDEGVKQRELATNFKLDGPVGIELLSNFNIDNTLQQWKVKYPKFFPYDFNMRDFKAKNKSLSTVDIYNDLYKKGVDCFACVINSDWYSGRGKHWMALFGDFRNPERFSIEFFNSSGQAPLIEFATWLLDVKAIMEKIVVENNIKNNAGNPMPVILFKVCNIQQQYSRTECGVYSLYYIWARLNKITPEFFIKLKIDDIKMFEFRQHLFWNPEKSIIKEGERFEYDKFKEKFNPKWEGDAPKYLR